MVLMAKIVTWFRLASSSTSASVFELAVSCPSPTMMMTRRGSYGSPGTSARSVQAR